MPGARLISRLAAVGIHLAAVGVALSMPSSPPPPPPREIPITLSMVAPPEPPPPKPVEKVVEPKPQPKPTPKPKPVVKETPPPTPVPDPAPEPLPVIASARASVAQQTVAVPEPAPVPPPPPSPGSVKAKDDYFARLLAWLERHKRYPFKARSKRREGTALVWFQMDRNGQVRGCRLEGTSGSEMLDEAAVAMVERASPMPPFPKEMTDQSLELVVPVEFYIR
jgi:protein TonB